MQSNGIRALARETNSAFDVAFVRAAPEALVAEVARLMAASNADVAVIESETGLQGIFTPKDYLIRLIGAGRDPSKTTIREVMTHGVVSISASAHSEEAAQLVRKMGFRDFPVTDDSGRVVALLSTIELCRERIRELDRENKDLEAYLRVDGIGGD